MRDDEYVAHLADAHGLVDDPGTSSVVTSLEPLEQHEGPSGVAAPSGPYGAAAGVVDDGSAGAPMPPRGVWLDRDEVMVAFVEGDGPPPPQIGGRKKSVIVGGVIGGAVGAAVGAAVAGGAQKYRGRVEARTLALTNQRMIFLRFHIPESEVPVEAIKYALVKVVGPGRRAVVIKSRAARALRVEGPANEIEEFAAAVNSYVRYAAWVRGASGPPP